jgi:excisionase family DNA binding protein
MDTHDTHELLLLDRLTITEAAQLCQVSRRTVERWIRTGQVRAVQVGSRRQVVTADLPVKLAGPPREKPQREPPEKARQRWNAAALADL